MSETLAGRIAWIGLAPEPRAAPVSVATVAAAAGSGLAGDHHARRPPGSKRQVTLISAGSLREVERELGRAVTPDLCRRNLVVEGLDLRALLGTVLRIGEVRLEVSGPCEPCSRMEENLGPGGRAALRERGGVTARVLRGGTIRVGAAISVEAPPSER